jgi:hypothetical protein
MYNNHLFIYNSLLNNKNFPILINLILKINNYLNKSTGKKELKFFDLKNVESLIELKISSKSFIEYLLRLYHDNIENFNKGNDIFRNIIDDGELCLLKVLIQPHNLISSIDHEFKSAIEDFKTNGKSLEMDIKNDVILIEIKKINDKLEGEFDKLIEVKENEDKLREELLNYFNLYEKKNSSGNLNSIFKILIKLETNLRRSYLNSNVKTTSNQSHLNNGKSIIISADKNKSNIKTGEKTLPNKSSLFNIKYKL